MRRFLVLAALGIVAGAHAADSEADRRAQAAYGRLVLQAGGPLFQASLASIAQFGSRLAGSPGERRALEYVEAEFRRLGLQNVRREPFQVTIPDPESRGWLQFGTEKIELWPLWPNLVRTSTCRLSASMVWGGKGSLTELSGKRLQGAIVVLEFDSGDHWKLAFQRGARAAIFLEPPEMRRIEAEAKFSSAPLNAPRFLVPRHLAPKVRAWAEQGQAARLDCHQRWVVRETFNVMGDLPGADLRSARERVVIAAPADAMSITPGSAPGASGAASLAALLELARLSAANPGRRPMRFLAVAANGLGLQGWREYAERRVAQNTESFLHVTLDLTDGNRTLGAFARAWFYAYRNEPLDPVRAITRSMRDHANRIAPLAGAESGRHVLLDAANESDGRTWRNTIFGKFAFGCEPLLLAGIPAVTLATVEEDRHRIDTPHDTVERMSASRLRLQLQSLACLAWHWTRDPNNRNELSEHKIALDPVSPRRLSLVGGFGTLEGQVVKFDPNRSFIPNIPVPEALAVLENTQKTFGGVRGPLVQSVSSTGHYRFLGLAPASAYFHLDSRVTSVAAYGLDPVSGDIRVACTDGMVSRSYEREFEMVTSYRSLPLVVFDATPTDLYGLVDPQELRVLYRYRLMDPVADAEPRNYSMAQSMFDPKRMGDKEDSAVLFTESEAPFKLLMGSSAGEWRLLLTGASSARPSGEGFRADRLGGRFDDVARQSASDLFQLNQDRLDRFAKYRILSPGLKELAAEAEVALEHADRARESLRWVEADSSSRAAWSLALRNHPMIQKTVDDVVAGVLFYLVLLIPFSYFLERLFFARRSLTAQLLAAVGIFVASFLALRAIHPAFEVVSNPSMIFIAFVMGALSLMVTVLIVGKFETSLKELRSLRTGTGHVDIGRMNVAMAAFNLGIANMRRRKARTLLTTLTLVVMTFIVLSFTSIVPELQLADQATGRPATFPGLLVRNPGLEPLPEVTARALASEFAGRGDVVRRAWFAGVDSVDHGILGIRRNGKSADMRAAVGFESRETAVTRPDRALLPGGRWFRPGDRQVAILPVSLAEKLGLDPAEDLGARFEFAGRPVSVIGFADEALLKSVVDLDGESILPADFTLSNQAQARSASATQAFRKFVRLDPGVCLLLPAEDVMALGGEIRSIGIRLSDAASVQASMRSIMPRLRMNVYAGVPKGTSVEVRQFSVLQGARSVGLGLVLVQMLIASVFVLNTMVASVYERKREISIFSSIGLAPNHIAVLFFAESCVYGVLGAVAGYFVAQGAARFVIETGLAPGLYLNFSATSAVLSAVSILAIVLLSTLYPAKIAERLAAPAYESETMGQPEGDRWIVRLPFRVNVRDVEPLLRFFFDWFAGHEEYAVGEFVTSDPKLLSEGDSLGAVECTAWLAPFDLGVSQSVRIEACASAAPEVAELDLILTRLGGEPRNWQNVNGRFYQSIRRHFLAWRTRPDSAN